MAIEEFNPEELTIDELVEKLEHNVNECKKMTEEIDKIKDIESNKSSDMSDIDLDSFVYNEDLEYDDEEDYTVYVESIKNTEIEEKFQECLKDIKQILKENMLEKLREVLSQYEGYYFEKIVNMVKLELLKDQIEMIRDVEEEKYMLKDLLKKCDDPSFMENVNYEQLKDQINFKKEFIEEFEEEISLNKEMIDDITLIANERMANYESKEEISEEESKQQYHLIFDISKGGNVKALEDIKNINKERYGSIKRLLDGFKEGKPKDVKKFDTNNKKTRDIWESRDVSNNIRILYKRFGRYNYVIIGIFVKKSTSENGYRNTLNSKISKFNSRSAEIEKNLNNPEFLDTHQKIECEIYNILDEGRSINNKTDDAVKKKGGDSNDE